MKKEIQKIPRFLLAGTGSGAGKTTVTCAILQALVNRGLSVASFKCGPDYIDPMFHSQVIGAQSRNLDVYLCGEKAIPFLLAKNSKTCDVALIEGVMGLYDGQGFDSDNMSSNHIARLTQSPTVLIVNVKGMGRSLAAMLYGYLNFAPNRIAGVIFNQCSAGMYSSYRRLVEEMGLKSFGYLPAIREASLESRHLGLVTAAEIGNLKEKLRILAQAAEESIDCDSLLRLADAAPPVEFENLWENVEKIGDVKVGVARDKAFCFFYQDNLELLEAYGARLCYFSPLEEEGPPEGICGLVLPGGYPEEYAEQLSQNRSMCEEIKKCVGKGIPLLAECGGFMYLLKEMLDREGRSFAMTGALPGSSHMTQGLTRFGYLTLTAKEDNLLCRKGETLPAHEFHYSDSDNNGSGFSACRRGKSWECIHADGTMAAGYPHFHFAGHPEAAGSFVKACLAYQQKIKNHQLEKERREEKWQKQL